MHSHADKTQEKGTEAHIFPHIM